MVAGNRAFEIIQDFKSISRIYIRTSERYCLLITLDRNMIEQ